MVLGPAKGRPVISPDRNCGGWDARLAVLPLRHHPVRLCIRVSQHRRMDRRNSGHRKRRRFEGSARNNTSAQHCARAFVSLARTHYSTKRTNLALRNHTLSSQSIFGPSWGIQMKIIFYLRCSYSPLCRQTSKIYLHSEFFDFDDLNDEPPEDFGGQPRAFRLDQQRTSS